MTLVVVPRELSVDANGTPRVGAKMYIFDATTTTPRTSYTTPAFSVAHPHPIPSLSSGLWPAVWVNPTGGPYKIVIRAADDDGSGTPLVNEDNQPVIPFDQATLGITLFPRTTAEIAADITPENYAYAAGDIRRHGAVGDGSTDDTDAIQRALTVGQDVFIPQTVNYYKVSTRLELTSATQCVYGEGQRSKIVQTGTNANATVFRAHNLGRNEFHGLYVIPGTTVTSVTDGFGFLISNSDYSAVIGCRVTDHRRGGVMLNNSDHCSVLDNWIVDSVIADSPTDTQSDTGADVYLYGACSYNIVRGNHCLNGAGLGIAVQTITSGDHADHNVLDGNVITFQALYGIMLYLFNATDTCNYNIIRGNKIDTVTGDVSEDGGLFTYGAGIYVQTADHTIIDGNHIRNTNTHASPSLQNVPAAIALSGIANALITNNLIENPGYWAIACIQATAYTASGRGLLISNNKVRDCPQRAVYLLDVVMASILGNQFHGTGGQGIYIRQATLTQSDDFIVAGNRIDGFVVGLQCEGTINRSHVHNNIVRGNTGAGIVLAAAFTNCHDNTVINGAGGDGISILSTCVNGFCRCNFVQGGDFGYVDDAGGTLRFDDNQYSLSSPPTTPHSTSQFRVLPNSATPSVRNARWVSIANTTTITDFLDGYRGQVLTVKALASFSVTDNANIVLAGGANFAMVSGDTLTLLKDGGAWTEVSRGDN